MTDLLSTENIKRIDQSDMFALLCSYSSEIDDARKLANSFELKGSFENLHEIVVIGMGGSAIGGDLLRCYLKDYCEIPVIVSRSYSLPKYIDHNTLVFACSFSGQTEETLSAFRELDQIGARVVSITSGGELAAIARACDYNLLSIPNGRQPRTALCYLFLPMIVVLERVGFIPDQASAFEEATQVVAKLVHEYANIDNPAKQQSYKLFKKLPLIYTSDTMEAVGMRWRCQFNENSQMLAYSNILPELNHNEIVGWDQSTVVMDETHVVLLRDNGESPRIKRRFEITKDIIKKHNSSISEINSKGTSLLTRMLSLIVFGDFTSFYLAVLNNVDPTPVENIKFLKQELANVPQ